ncbi:methionine--tRNA ligase subunit beta, partial [Shewanella sp.]|uniref:methionine--tRNA ligase subunit beta n=1 Tax=Shewanella sp. TaxID=50422 RepID=UPI003566CB62
LTWSALNQDLAGHEIAPFKAMMQRVELDKVNAMVADSKDNLQVTADAPKTAAPEKTVESSNVSSEPLVNDPISETINFDDFAKIDLRIARIVKAEHVADADKLLKLQLDIGGETRQVFAGIKSAYSPEDLEGKLTVMVANLAPRKMRFGMSEGMVLATGPGGSDLWILEPHEGAQPGMRVK